MIQFMTAMILVMYYQGLGNAGVYIARAVPLAVVVLPSTAAAAP